MNYFWYFLYVRYYIMFVDEFLVNFLLVLCLFMFLIFVFFIGIIVEIVG